jgi:Reverse transcriptase (RNA-dependent DNA polymerase)
VAVILGLTIKQMDVKSAYLCRHIDERMVIKLLEVVYPVVFCHQNVGVLNKATYRLKQSPLLWCKRLSGVLVWMRFGRCEVGPCVYAREVGFCNVSVYVDGVLICGKRDGAGIILKTQLTHNFTMTDMGETKEIVG